ncbi:MAG: sialate O-acetylesterase [Blautia sp.]|nr:sialate O-acetylesterase [Blautia sp.]MCM1202420.1 sialate O-acetylesterase [Bacteroides fragilis]
MENIQINPVFSDHMVLQRDKEIVIWGTAEEDCSINVRLNHVSETVWAKAGKWRTALPPMSAAEGLELVVSDGREELRITDVAIGEVWIAGGQSNMEFWMRYEKHYQEILPSCHNPNIRFYDMPKLAYDGQENDFDYHNVGIWRKADRNNLEYFSAVGYYMAERLEEKLGIPIGVIGCNWGGTKSLSWMKEEHAKEIQKGQTESFYLKLKGQSYDVFCRTAGKNAMNDTGNSVWNPFNDFILPGTPSEEEIKEFIGQGISMESMMELAKPQDAPGALYRHMVQRLAPYTVRGVLWYQGESDDETGETQKNYKAALAAIKEDWRDAWGNPGLPFFIVQLPGFSSWFGCVNRGFSIVRECQQQAVDEDPDAYLCSISDAGEEFDIHPKDKRVVGERLALLAEKYVYGKNILADAPRLRGIRREGQKIVLSFQNAEGGLFLKGGEVNALAVSDGGEEIRYSAAVSGEEIVITLCKDVPGALTVKFARGPWYQVNLYNRAGIPAIPFETVCPGA